MENIEARLKPFAEYLKNPYVIGVVGILALVYGPLMAPKLPPNIAVWFDNPVFKILFMFVILAVHNISPAVSIILTLGLIISLQTLSRYKIMGMADQIAQITATRPQPQAPKNAPIPLDESVQIHQELGAVIKGDKNPIHPLNRPTKETDEMQKRVENPNDPNHPSGQRLNQANLNPAIYELNPPFVKKNKPKEFKESDNVQPVVIPPTNKPHRYSAYHGYMPTMTTHSPHVSNPDLESNQMRPMSKGRYLPMQFQNDPVMPKNENMNFPVGTQ